MYLDYAATAPLLPEVRELMCEYSTAHFGNASSLYREGKAARQRLEEARAALAAHLDCAPQELHFCSGGTEAAGTLIEGIARGAAEGKGGKRRAQKHIICAAFEHHAVLNSALSLKRSGFEVELLRPNREGRIPVESLEAALRPDTLLVMVMFAQNELGTVQDIASLAESAHRAGALFMSDCVQAFGKLPLSLADLELDAACFSAHKLGGPVGTGAFYLRPSTPFLARQLGGGQEQNLRSGTQNIVGALGFAQAADISFKRLYAGEAVRLAALRDNLLSKLTQGSERISSTVSLEPADLTTHLPGFLHVLVKGIESETLVLRLDELGFAVSGGSACSTGSLEPSHVLTAMGISKDTAYGALRITLGVNTSVSDSDRFAEALLTLL